MYVVPRSFKIKLWDRSSGTQIISPRNVDVGQVLNLNKLNATVGEPVLTNPNSYASLKQIMPELKENHNIGSEQEWTFLGCDESPYCVAN